MSEETSVVRTIGRFHAVDELGRGGMGVVYRGYDPVIGRTVALKTIGFSSDDDEARQLRQRLYREASAAGTLTHPNIVTIYDVVEDGSTTAVAMEFVEGQTLGSIISQRGALPLDLALDLFGQICSALDYAGAKGIVHRDIKPANILITPEGRAKITDFGIARMSASGLTQTGTILGSPSYMSPEQVKGQSLDRRSDLFSAAVVLFQMLTGERPFAGDDVATTMYRIVNEPPPPLETFNQTISPAVTAVLHRALAKEPANRYQTGAEFVAALRQAIEGVSPSAFEFQTPLPQTPGTPKRSKLPRLLIAGGGGIVLVLVLLILAGRGGDSGQSASPPEGGQAAPAFAGAEPGPASPPQGAVQVPAAPQLPPATQASLPGPAASSPGPASTVPPPAGNTAGPASTVPPLSPDRAAAPRSTSANPAPSRGTPKAAPALAGRNVPPPTEVQDARPDVRETRRLPDTPGERNVPPPAAAAPAPPPTPTRTDAELRVMFEGTPYPVAIYADDTVVGRVDQSGGTVVLPAGTVRLRAVNDDLFLNANLGSFGLKPGDRRPISLPATASAVLAVRGESYQGVRMLIDGRQLPGPYPAQVPRIAAGTHRVTFRWVSGSAAGKELEKTVNLTAGGHFLLRAVLEDSDVVVQQVR